MNLRIFVLLSVGLLSSSFSRAEIIIDDFSVGTPLTQIGAGTNTRTTPDPGLLGGERDESITVPNLGGSQFQASIGFTENFVFTQGSNDQASGFLRYDNFSSFDLTDSGANTHLSIGFRSNDIDAAIPNVVTITAESATNSATQAVTIPASSSLPEDVFVDFANFAGVDFMQLEAITLSFDTQSAAGRDFQLEFFSGTNPNPVPEPSSALIALLGVAMVIQLRRTGK